MACKTPTCTQLIKHRRINEVYGTGIAITRAFISVRSNRNGVVPREGLGVSVHSAIIGANYDDDDGYDDGIEACTYADLSSYRKVIKIARWIMWFTEKRVSRHTDVVHPYARLCGNSGPGARFKIIRLPVESKNW